MYAIDAVLLNLLYVSAETVSLAARGICRSNEKLRDTDFGVGGVAILV